MFWGLIDSVNAQVACDDKEKVLKATREALCELSSGEIAEWYEIYRDLHKAAYRDDLWDAVEACGIHATDDGFIDFRAWLISRGQEVYEAVMVRPESLSAYVPEPREANFELYGYISSDAFAEKACREALGNDGFAAFKMEWIADHQADIEENAEWNASSVELCSEKLFYSMLVKECGTLTLEAKLQKAQKEAEQASRGLEDKDKRLE